jgi:isopentenyl-diphosphate Delta-isomerase
VSKTQDFDRSTILNITDDPSASVRKTHHLEMAEKAQALLTSSIEKGRNEFFYEPLLHGFPDLENLEFSPFSIGQKKLKAPLWISSMTGGTGEARHINQRLAHAAKEFGLGMGLGSCRQLLHSDEFFEDFNLRPIVGEDICLMANFGMAQIDQYLSRGEINKVVEVCKRLQVDGLFIHINPMQEFYQPEGDRWSRAPIEVIDEVLGIFTSNGFAVGIKEVGQGMGPRSLAALMERPIAAIEFGSFGGTNFSTLEKMRSGKNLSSFDMQHIGHNAQEMVDFINDYLKNHPTQSNSTAPAIIISGGIRSYLQGYALMERLNTSSIYAMGLPFLTHAALGQEELNQFITSELQGLKMAQQFLNRKEN